MWTSNHEKVDIDVSVPTMKDHNGDGDTPFATLLNNQSHAEVGEYTINVSSDIRIALAGVFCSRRGFLLGVFCSRTVFGSQERRETSAPTRRF